MFLDDRAMAFLHRNWYNLLIVAVVFGLDQLTKWVVIANVPLYSSVPRQGFFRITHVPNTGSAFGLFSGQNLVLTLIAATGVALILYFLAKQAGMGWMHRVSLSLMLGGALGNLTDRLIHGWVTDFIDIGPWYIFNVADASIVSGVLLLIAAAVLPQKKAPASGEPDAVSAEAVSDDHPNG